jgi:S-DNA-T family DNA segregation ATPase FtsK/SpoIIIE
MFMATVELAVDSGKISTSLIQRKLHLGYGRAAKIIDRMEQMGYVSAPDGSKPRDVLISKQEFMEMRLKEE